MRCAYRIDGSETHVTLEIGHDVLGHRAARAARAAASMATANSSSRWRAGSKCCACFTPTEGLLGNGEIAERTGLPKPTVSRLTYTLTKLGYLAHVERLAKYQLAPAALALGYTALANIRIRQLAPHPHAGARGLCRRRGRARHARPARSDLPRACALQARRDAAPDAGLAPADRHHRDGPRADRRHAGRASAPGCSATSSGRKARTGRRSRRASSARSRSSRRAASRSRSANGSVTSTRSACR